MLVGLPGAGKSTLAAALSQRIPDARIRMDHFRTVRHIADTFAAPRARTGDADVAA